jgi:hypothetical protein
MLCCNNVILAIILAEFTTKTCLGGKVLKFLLVELTPAALRATSYLAGRFTELRVSCYSVVKFQKYSSRALCLPRLLLAAPFRLRALIPYNFRISCRAFVPAPLSPRLWARAFGPAPFAAAPLSVCVGISPTGSGPFVDIICLRSSPRVQREFTLTSEV